MTDHQNPVYEKNENKQVNISSSTLRYPTEKKMDSLDPRIISLMVTGLANKEISTKLKAPLSTTQRRTRKLIEQGIVTMRAEVDLAMMGYKKGLIHVYISNGNIEQIARRISTLDSIESVEIHIGNSDMIGNVIYSDNRQLLQTISDIKKIGGVDHIVWSEEVFNIRDYTNKFTDLLS
jgi:DNA-binding Lrp family transcriptional regulator